MGISEICSDIVEFEKSVIRRNLQANLLKIKKGNLIQYKTNPSGKGNFMFYIPEGTCYFKCKIKRNGGLINYIIEARGKKGKFLKSFHYLF